MSKRNLILTVVAITAVVLIIGLVLRRNDSNSNFSDETNSTDGLSGIQYQEATDQEKQESENNKEDVVRRTEQEEQAPETSAEKKQVKPIISAYGQNSVNQKVEVGSYVPGVFETGGTCITTLSKGSAAKEKTTQGTENVSSVSCGFAAWEKGELTAGNWEARVSYNSATASGISDVTVVEVK